MHWLNSEDDCNSFTDKKHCCIVVRHDQLYSNELDVTVSVSV